MDNVSANGAPIPDAPESRRAGRKRTWLIVLAVTSALLICGCMSAVFLVLTGIIAEPETVIEQILRALSGG